MKIFQKLKVVSQSVIVWRWSVFAVLLLIALQLGGWSWLRDAASDVEVFVRNFGQAEEAPARRITGQGGGILDLHADEALRAATQEAMRAAPSASAAAPR